MTSLWRDRGLMLIVMLIAAIGWFFSKNGISHFQPFEFMAYRFALGALLLATLIGSRDWSRHNLMAGLRLGLVFTIAMIFWILALDISSIEGIGLGGFLLMLGIVLSPLIGRFMYNEPLHRGYFVSLGVALAGGIFMAPGMQSSALPLFVSASLFLAIYMTMMTRVSRNNDPFVITIVGFGVVSSTMAIASLISETREPVSDPAAWLWLGLSGLIATAYRFLLQARVQGRLLQSEASMIMNLEGVAVALIAVWLTGVNYTHIQWIGAALVTASAMTLIGWKGKTQTR